MYFTCLKLLANEQDAKDVMQESYLAAMNSLGTLRDGASFESWVCGIAVNLCRQRFKKPAEASIEEREEFGELPPADDLLIKANIDVYDEAGEKTTLNAQEFTVNAEAGDITASNNGTAHGQSLFRAGDHWFIYEYGNSSRNYFQVAKLDTNIQEYEDTDDYTYLKEMIKPYFYDTEKKKYVPVEEYTDRQVDMGLWKDVVNFTPGVTISFAFADDPYGDENRLFVPAFVDGDNVVLLMSSYPEKLENEQAE